MVSINFSTGEHVQYQGNDAVILSNNHNTHSLTIRLENGEIVTVDKNDLFGMNKNLFEGCINDCKTRIANLDEEYEERSQKAKFSLKAYYLHKLSAKNYKAEADKVLGDKSFSALSGKEKADYEEAMHNYKDAKHLAYQSDCDFRNNNSAALDCVCTKSKWNNQLSIAQTMQSIFG